MAGRSVELVVSDGTVRSAIRVGLTDPEHLADSVEPGSWVAIFVSEDPEPHLADGSARKLPPLTRILLPEAQVLGVAETARDDAEPAARAARMTLTLAVTQTEAEKVIHGARNGDLTFALRSRRRPAVDRPGTTVRRIAPELYGSAS